MNNSTKVYLTLLRMALAVRNAASIGELAASSHAATGAISFATSLNLLQGAEMTRYFDLTNNAWDIRYDELKTLAKADREAARKASLATTARLEPCTE